jgi:tRNA (mo5U34)-methyltransferase
MKTITEDIEKKIKEISWFHHFDKETFGFETIGAKGQRNNIEAAAWGLNAELFKDKSVLDIGAWDGYNSFLAEKMGAKRVLATDRPIMQDTGFNLAHYIIGSKIESKKIDLFDISIETVGKFDVVLFLGVFYHLPNPILGLQRAADVTDKVLVVETTYENQIGGALLELFPPRLTFEPTNYWSPNVDCLEALLKKICGFKKVDFKIGEPNEDRLICFAYR